MGLLRDCATSPINRFAALIKKLVSLLDPFYFRSVPYAKQPVGARRFKVPEPLDAEDAWEGARDSTRQLPHCHQTDPFTGLRVGREDCLMLNVYTPDLEPDTKLPVMVTRAS